MMRVVNAVRSVFATAAKPNTTIPVVVKSKSAEDPNQRLQQLSLTVGGLRTQFEQNKSKIVDKENELEMAEIEFKTAFLEAKDVQHVATIAEHLKNSFNPDLLTLNEEMKSAHADHQYFSMNQAAELVADKLAAALLRIRIGVLKPDAKEMLAKLFQELEALAHIPDILPANFNEWIKQQKWLKDLQAYSEMYAVIETIIADLTKVNACIAKFVAAPSAERRLSSTNADLVRVLNLKPAEPTPQNTPTGSPRAADKEKSAAAPAANASSAGLRLVGSPRLSVTVPADSLPGQPQYDTPRPSARPALASI